MLQALQWLKLHNKYYRDININFDHLNQLPVDGNLSGLTAVEDPTTLEENEHLEGDDDEDSNNIWSFFPITAQKMTEKEVVGKSVAEGKTPAQQVVPRPQRGDTPINEFITEGYISCAFPTLPETWFALEVTSSASECCTMPAVCVRLGSSGSNRGADSLLSLTPNSILHAQSC